MRKTRDRSPLKENSLYDDHMLHDDHMHVRIKSLEGHFPDETLRHELRNPHNPGNNSNNWLDQSAASYMLAGYNPQSFHIYFSDMGWRLASRAICLELSP
ncbi:hypothetical protein TNCV_404761 [Trichonephila clavipes]|nr:hypothetical protein TNCV_404761 [Trichonephila clavipes]